MKYKSKSHKHLDKLLAQHELLLEEIKNEADVDKAILLIRECNNLEARIEAAETPLLDKHKNRVVSIVRTKTRCSKRCG